MGGPHAKLTMGVNLKGLVGSVTMKPGEATIAQDVMYRDDGAFMKHWGWLRRNVTALGGTVYGIKGFSYKGKNSPDVRAGNYGANDGANFTKRLDFYSGVVALTDTQLLRWDAATEAFVAVSLVASGITVDPNPKPTIIVTNDLVYIVGWGDTNIKYDPVDELAYGWGWDFAPGATGAIAGAYVGPFLIRGRYRYWCSFINLFTGEESALQAVDFAGDDFIDLDGAQAVTLTLQSYGVDLGGDRHYNDGVADANEDIGIVIYRGEFDQNVPFFLGEFDFQIFNRDHQLFFPKFFS